jgi:hypothetical protein
MTDFRIASLVLKIVGIYSLVSSIDLIQPLITAFAMSTTWTNISLLFIGALVPFLLLIIVGCFFLFYSNKLATKMISSDENNIGQELSSQNIQTIAFSIVGLILIVIAIPKLFYIGSNMYAFKKAGDEAVIKNMSLSTYAYAASLIVQFILGLIIFLGAKGLSSLWFFLQKTREH